MTKFVTRMLGAIIWHGSAALLIFGIGVILHDQWIAPHKK